jgi:acyl-CoA reductase-like NAD-dependent aldehyde dehydrogenase
MTDDDISYSFYIDGRWVRSPHAHAVPVINAATEENVANTAHGLQEYLEVKSVLGFE